MAKDKHEHKFIRKDKVVLLHKYRAEDGEMKAVNTVGKDTLKQWVCECGAKQTFNLKRTKV